jgi:tetratricopeptide (TPR) repeat protein
MKIRRAVAFGIKLLIISFVFVLPGFNFAAAQTTAEIVAQTSEIQIKAAEKTLEIALLSFDDRPNSAEIEFSAALEYINKQEYTTAIELLKKAVELDPGFAKAYYNIGVCLSRLGMDHNASAQFEYAIGKNPNYIDAYHNNIVIFNKTGKYKEAAGLAENAIGLCNKLKLYERAELYKKILETIKTRYKEEKKAEKKNKYSEKEIAEILGKMRVETDDIADSAKYEDKSSTVYRNVESFHLMVKKFKDAQKPYLYLKIQRSGEEYLGIQSYTIKTDDNKFEIKLGWNDLVTDLAIGNVSESYTCPITGAYAEMIKSISKSKKTVVRYHGRQFYDDRTISAKELKAFNNMIKTFEALGGDLDDMDI